MLAARAAAPCAGSCNHPRRSLVPLLSSASDSWGAALMSRTVMARMHGSGSITPSPSTTLTAESPSRSWIGLPSNRHLHPPHASMTGPEQAICSSGPSAVSHKAHKAHMDTRLKPCQHECNPVRARKADHLSSSSWYAELQQHQLPS